MNIRALANATLKTVGLIVFAVIVAAGFHTLSNLTGGVSSVLLVVAFFIWIGYDTYKDEAEGEEHHG